MPYKKCNAIQKVYGIHVIYSPYDPCDSRAVSILRKKRWIWRGLAMESSTMDVQLDWSDERMLPEFQRPEQLTVYDVRKAPYEVQLSVATVVGVINRLRPRIYLLSRDNDAFWLSEVLTDIPHTLSDLRDEEILYDIIMKNRAAVESLVIYDPELPDTVNVATVVAGLVNGVAVSPMQAEGLQQAPYELPVHDDLRRYHWVNRLQVYQWAYKNLLPLCSKRLVAGMDPKNALGVRPFLVATKTFIYWLNPLGFLPQTDQRWQSESGLLRKILRAYRSSAVHLGWFVQEGSGVTMTSKAGIPVVCTDYFSNLEVWSAVQPVPAPPVSSPNEQMLLAAEKKVYLSFTMSEGDNLQYIQERMLNIWRQEERGSLPVGWPMALMMLQAAPAMLEYYQRTATPADEFIAAPSGVAYSYPSKWPVALSEVYVQRTGQLMRKMDVKLLQVLDSNYWWHPLFIYRALTTGAGMMLIEPGLQRLFAQGLQQFGVRGILSGGGLTRVSWGYCAGTPVFQNLGTARSVAEAVRLVKRATPRIRPYFINLYVLAWRLGPKELRQVVEQLGGEYEVVTPGRLLGMLPAVDG
jgi:hypothetical protein